MRDSEETKQRTFLPSDTSLVITNKNPGKSGSENRGLLIPSTEAQIQVLDHGVRMTEGDSAIQAPAPRQQVRTAFSVRGTKEKAC